MIFGAMLDALLETTGGVESEAARRGVGSRATERMIGRMMALSFFLLTCGRGQQDLYRTVGRLRTSVAGGVRGRKRPCMPALVRITFLTLL